MMKPMTHRQYYGRVQKLSTAALVDIINAPEMHVHLTPFMKATIRLVLRQRQQRFEANIAEREATT
jgi:hypothetical protein